MAKRAELGSAISALCSYRYDEGTFVHIQNGHTDLMHILHANTAKGESERMRSLNGEAREVIRNNAQVTCIWPGSQDVVVSKSKPRQLLRPLDSSLANSEWYRIRQQNDDRVAGLATSVVDVMPADNLRYGYRFWIDKSNGMMLRSMVLNSENQPVEELMFTAISYPTEVDPSRFEVDVDVDTTQWLDAKGSKASTEPVRAKVRFEALPGGYQKRSETLRMMTVRKDGPVSHVVVSDGIATVSVYVEHVKRDKHDPSALGSTHMGAINAYGLSLSNALVTAVGEVPGDTVQRIARAARIAR